MVIGLPTGRSYTIDMHQRQIGTLYEFYIIGVVLVIAGAVLIPTHPAFLVLVLAGALIPFIPSLIRLRETLRLSAQSKQNWKELCEKGFKPAVAIRARVKEGGAYLAVDTENSRVAFITHEASRIVDLSTVREIRLQTHILSQWGHPDRTRFDLVFMPEDDPGGFGLSFPRKREAVKAYKKFRKILDGRVTFVEL